MLLSQYSGHIKSKYRDVDPDEVFFDSANSSKFDSNALEGKFERPLSRFTFIIFFSGILFIFLTFGAKAFMTQIIEGGSWSALADKNYLKSTPIFAHRGIIKDRNGQILAWNEVDINSTSTISIPKRQYIKEDGFSHILGYVSYPKKDKSGVFWQTSYIGADGIEKEYDKLLAGKSGERIIEVTASNKISNDSTVSVPVDGETVTLHIDADVQKIFHDHLKDAVEENNFSGGVGIMMDVNNGEVLAMTSYPEYSNNIFINASTTQEKNLKAEYLTSKRNPMLNRAIAGLIVPGSTVKPFMAYAALNEGVIDEYKNIYSSGALVIENKYGGPDTIFRDWKKHGYVDAREAIAVSSDEYFYQVGGGYKDQKGLGIMRIEKYMKMFGFASSTGIDLPGEKSGVVPSPDWKKRNFKDGDWLLGNTYHTSIGQYGFQTTPLELIRSIAIIANGGNLVTPHLVGRAEVSSRLELNPKYLQVAREGMRMAAEEGGTAQLLGSLPFKLAAKTGTAQLGFNNERVNTWTVGYFPYENPKYAFLYVMESGPASNTVSASRVMKKIFDDMLVKTPEYFKN